MQLTEEPLYCFKLQEDGTIETIVIHEWIRTNVSAYSRRFTIGFDNKKYPVNRIERYYRFDGDKLERFVSNKLFTFNPIHKDAVMKILTTINERAETAYVEYVKNTDISTKILNQYPEAKGANNE